VNLTRYVGNVPTMFADPTGMYLSGLAGSAWNSVTSVGAYLGGAGAAAIDSALGTNLVSAGSPTVSLAGGGHLMVVGPGGGTPFQQGASALNAAASEISAHSGTGSSSQINTLHQPDSRIRTMGPGSQQEWSLGAAGINQAFSDQYGHLTPWDEKRLFGALSEVMRKNPEISTQVYGLETADVPQWSDAFSSALADDYRNMVVVNGPGSKLIGAALWGEVDNDEWNQTISVLTQQARESQSLAGSRITLEMIGSAMVQHMGTTCGGIGCFGSAFSRSSARPAASYTANYPKGGTLGTWMSQKAAKANSGARSAVQARNLCRQLTSQEQAAQALAGTGEAVFGAGTGRPLLDAGRLSAQYGGNPADWAKMRSTSSEIHGIKTPAGNNFEIHWYQNIKTRQVVELKTKVTGH
jgi:hypothetical protein